MSFVKKEEESFFDSYWLKKFPLVKKNVISQAMPFYFSGDIVNLYFQNVRCVTVTNISQIFVMVNLNIHKQNSSRDIVARKTFRPESLSHRLFAATACVWYTPASNKRLIKLLKTLPFATKNRNPSILDKNKIWNELFICRCSSRKRISCNFWRIIWEIFCFSYQNYHFQSYRTMH